MTPPLPYRSCVGIALFNAAGHVFVGERLDSQGAWQMPQGGIDEGETPEIAAFRELKEETGTDKATILQIAAEKIRYDLPENLRKTLWNGMYRGQEQTWVAMRFTGQDSDIDLSAHKPQEFARWQWVPLAHTVDLIVPFKRKTYEKIAEFFKNLAIPVSD